MDSINIITSNPPLFISLVVIVGLIIGSMLSMLIYRLPIMLFSEWHHQCQEFLAEHGEMVLPPKPFNLFVPRSQCPHCHKQLTLRQNIPLLGYIWQRGKCVHCQAKIPLRYPLIELLTLLLTLYIGWVYGPTLQGATYLILTWGLICITFIDIEHQIIPDEITYVLIWLGLAASLKPGFVTPEDAIIGVIVGYLSLWIIGHLFRLIRKKEGIGYGDYKLLAMFGAWLGWQYLPLVLMLAAILGIIFGLIFMIKKGQLRDNPIAFAPYLAVAGWSMVIWKLEIHQLLMGWLL